MKQENENSFIEGPVFGSLIKFALPVLGALILQAAYGAVDLLEFFIWMRQELRLPRFLHSLCP